MELFQCAVVIPCLNEAGTIARVVADIRQFAPRVWVIDDGSSDQTGAEARRAGATVIRHSINVGKGAALRTGLRTVHSEGFEWALTMDGDGQHLAADIPHLAAAASAGVDLVIGNRMRGRPAQMGFVRFWTNRWMSSRLSRRVALPCPDTQCGFRAIRLSAWSAVRLDTDRFEVESETLLAFARAGFQIRFVPIQCQPQTRPSRIRPVADTIRWLRWWLRHYQIS